VSETDKDPLEGLPLSGGGDDNEFVLSPDLADRFWQFAKMIGAAAPSERLAAFRIAARRVAESLIHPEQFPTTEAASRLRAAAEAAGLLHTHDEDFLQKCMSEAFTAADQDKSNLLNLAPIEEDSVGVDEADVRPPEFSDEALALQFARRHGHELRYVAGWNKFYIWKENVWHSDDTLEVYDWARRLCREVASSCPREKVARLIAGKTTVSAVVTLARVDRRIAATIEQWDRDPLLLNSPSGVFDLRTGERRRHNPIDYMTKITAIGPDRACRTPTWDEFLKVACKDHDEYVKFLARVMGYSLTGLTREHALFFLYGTGANGKSTFINAVTGCIGDYHRVAPIEAFTAAKNDRHPTELAGLRGARLVTSVETEEGRRWAESKIKSLTGGDKIAARFMRQDFFEYWPCFKLLVAGNHKPSLRSVDEAIRRRFHLLPFMANIPPEDRDEKLGEKLRAEWPGILAWMIDGCLDWQKCGLDPPAVVTEATKEYLEAEDALSAWIDQAGHRDPTAFELSKDLFSSWKKYAQETGEWVGSERKFVPRLESRAASLGLTRDRNTAGRRGFSGLRLFSPSPRSNGDDEVPL
jgi:putative DNA primase/helicase